VRRRFIDAIFVMSAAAQFVGQNFLLRLSRAPKPTLTNHAEFTRAIIPTEVACCTTTTSIVAAPTRVRRAFGICSD
jgi:hypothetical protein